MKTLIKLATFSTLLALLLAPHVAGAFDPWAGGGESLELPQNVDLVGAVVNIINFILSLLGLIAVVLIIIGGFKYMMSGGDEGKVKAAKKLLIAGIVGLIIVILAYAIATFVIGLISNAAEGA